MGSCPDSCFKIGDLPIRGALVPARVAIVVGYGRAGKRHARLAEENRLEVVIVDPVNLPPAGRWFASLAAGLEIAAAYESVAIIATPPALHVEQARRCLDAGIQRVLVEKPLCALGQLDEAQGLPGDKVMAAYNYQYHPMLTGPEWRMTDRWTSGWWRLEARQHRPGGVPEWGLLLDHVSHDLQILNMMTGGLREVTGAEHVQSEDVDCWQLSGLTEGGDFWSISETVTKKQVERTSRLYAPRRYVDIGPSEEMHRRMWRAFLAGGGFGLETALKVQELMEEAWMASKISR